MQQIHDIHWSSKLNMENKHIEELLRVAISDQSIYVDYVRIKKHITLVLNGFNDVLKYLFT